MFPRADLRAVIFDCEGVIADTEPLWDAAQSELFQRRGVIYDRSAVKSHLVGLSLEAGAAWMIEKFQWSDSASALARERRQLMQRLLQNNATWMRGARDCLQWMRQSGFKFALATALDRELFVALDEGLGLHEMFSNQIYFLQDCETTSKEDGALFRMVASSCEWKPGECAVAEDAPAGLRGARAAGMYAIGFATTFGKSHLKDADFVVSDFHAFQRLISSGEKMR